MAGVRVEATGDRSNKAVTRTGTERGSAYLNTWKYGLEIIMHSDNRFEILIKDEITNERFTMIRADGNMIDWIMHNFKPESEPVIEPYDFDDNWDPEAPWL